MLSLTDLQRRLEVVRLRERNVALVTGVSRSIAVRLPPATMTPWSGNWPRWKAGGAASASAGAGRRVGTKSGRVVVSA